MINELIKRLEEKERQYSNELLLTIMNTEAVEAFLWFIVTTYVAMFTTEPAVIMHNKLQAKGQYLGDKVCGYDRLWPAASTLNAIASWEERLDPSFYTGFNQRRVITWTLLNVKKIYEKCFHIDIFNAEEKVLIAILKHLRLTITKERWQAKRDSYKAFLASISEEEPVKKVKSEPEPEPETTKPVNLADTFAGSSEEWKD